MRLGIPYDSAQACGYAGAITAILSGQGYQTSADIAKSVGAFAGYANNRDSMLDVMQLHRDAAYSIDSSTCPQDLLEAAKVDWDICLEREHSGAIGIPKLASSRRRVLSLSSWIVIQRELNRSSPSSNSKNWQAADI